MSCWYGMAAHNCRQEQEKQLVDSLDGHLSYMLTAVYTTTATELRLIEAN